MNGVRRRIRASLLSVLITGSFLVPYAIQQPADAAGARVTVVNDRGTAKADATYRTKLSITGRGFQTIKGGFGGIYLMFGWVDDPAGGSWRPSRGGITGEDYRYVPDSESANNQGYLKFIAFPGSSTEAEAQAVLSLSGRFSISLTVPGPTFRSVDRNGKPHDVDCRRVRCGVITIGAHGVKNPRNETFTPVPFGNVYGGRAPARSSPTSQPGSQPTSIAGATTPGAPQSGGSVGPARTAPVTAPTTNSAPAATTLTVDRRTARAGNVMAFTATGFRPGEGVVGVLDDGVAGVGPMVAGSAGDVAGVLRLPRTLAAGTHEFRLSGAASSTRTSDRFPVQAAADETAARSVPVAESRTGTSASRLFLVAGAAVLVLVAGMVGRRAVLRRRSHSPIAGADS